MLEKALMKSGPESWLITAKIFLEPELSKGELGWLGRD